MLRGRFFDGVIARATELRLEYIEHEEAEREPRFERNMLFLC